MTQASPGGEAPAGPGGAGLARLTPLFGLSAALGERTVQLALDGLMRGRSTLVIAHRLAAVKSADRIVVMDHGRIVATGTHDSLVGEDGLYARLAALQFATTMDNSLR